MLTAFLRRQLASRYTVHAEMADKPRQAFDKLLLSPALASGIRLCYKNIHLQQRHAVIKTIYSRGKLTKSCIQLLRLFTHTHRSHAVWIGYGGQSTPCICSTPRLVTYLGRVLFGNKVPKHSSPDERAEARNERAKPVLAMPNDIAQTCLDGDSFTTATRDIRANSRRMPLQGAALHTLLLLACRPRYRRQRPGSRWMQRHKVL